MRVTQHRPAKAQSLDALRLLPPDLERACAEVQKILGHRFKDRLLLCDAIDQRLSKGSARHQQLEFLGDQVLRHILTIYTTAAVGWPLDSGAVRNAITLWSRNDVLTHYMRHTGLTKWMRAESEGAWSYGDFAEAIIGAAFIDGGEGAARRVVVSLYGKDLRAPILRGYFQPTDYKFPTSEDFEKSRKGAVRFLDDRARRRLFNEMVVSFCEPEDPLLGLSRFAEPERLLVQLTAVACKEAPCLHRNRTHYVMRGEAAFAAYLIAQNLPRIGTRPHPEQVSFQNAREQLLLLADSTFETLASCYHLRDLSFDSRPCSLRHIYFGFLGVAVTELGAAHIVAREANRIRLAPDPQDFEQLKGTGWQVSEPHPRHMKPRGQRTTL